MFTRPPTSPSLLSPAGYDDDVASLRTLSDQESDSEDDQLVQASRSTLELTQHDLTVLEEEEERERLLTKTKSSPTVGLRRIFGANPHSNESVSVRIGKRESRRKRKEERAMTRERRQIEKRKRRRSSLPFGQESERNELMYEMEEGDLYKDERVDDDDLTSVSSSSISDDLDASLTDERGYSRRVGLLLFVFCHNYVKSRIPNTKINMNVRFFLKGSLTLEILPNLHNHRRSILYSIPWCL